MRAGRRHGFAGRPEIWREGRGESTSDDLELKRLRGENTQLPMERDVSNRSVVADEGGDEVSVARFAADPANTRCLKRSRAPCYGASTSGFYTWLAPLVTIPLQYDRGVPTRQ
jgi:hypothetical protein